MSSNSEQLFASLEAIVKPVLTEEYTSEPHPGIDLLQDLRNGWVPESLQAELRLHLAVCSICREEFAGLAVQTSQTFSEEAFDDELPEEFESSGVLVDSQWTSDEFEQEADTELLGEPEEVIPEPSVATSGLSGWYRAMSAVGLLGLLLFVASPYLTSMWDNDLEKIEGFAKGRPAWMKGVDLSHPDFSSRAMIHLGVSDGFGLPVRRLHRETPCNTSQGLFFVFSLAKPGGYIYLFRVIPDGSEKPELLYPFDLKTSVYQDSGALHVVQQKKSVVRYPLTQEKGEVMFILLQVKKPLSKASLERWLQQREGWKEPAQLADKVGGTKPSSYDRFSVRVRVAGGRK